MSSLGTFFFSISRCPVVYTIALCMSEMATFLPISSPFVRFAGRFVDPAFGVAAGYNFFLFQASLCKLINKKRKTKGEEKRERKRTKKKGNYLASSIEENRLTKEQQQVPFEITVCNLVIRYWTTAIPTWAVCLIFLALYAALNYIRVSGYGEAEFWMSIGKVILIVGLILYTFIVMVGGNPKHDAFGFRYWKNPGAFTTKYREGDTGRFLGFLYCLFQAAFVVAGPEYVSMTAGEVRK